MRTARHEKIWDLLACLALCGCAFFVVMRFCAGTSPLRPDEYLWDSALFQAVGKLWADGLVPYKDIFDHKGPLLFLIQRIAYSFDQPRVALYVLESLSVSAALGFAYAALRLKLQPLWAFGGALLTLVFWLPLMEYGNLCETYSMPFLMLPLWLQLKYLQSGRKRHPWRYAFVYGLCFGANLLIRPNNGLLIALLTLVITLDLAWRRQYGNIVRNGIMLYTGVIISVIPFVAYFEWKGAIGDLLYATWTFNLIYANSLEMTLVMQNLRSVLFFITPSLLSLLLSAACFVRRRCRLGFMLALGALGTLYITLGGVGYAHYFMLQTPLIPLCLYAACKLARGVAWKRAMALCCLCFALLCVRTTLSLAQENWVSAPTAQEAAQEQAYDELVYSIEQAIPPQDRSSVAMCGLLVTDAELILKTDLHPVGRYCFLMEWHARADQYILTSYANFLRSGEARWVILRREGVTDEGVLSALEETYALHSTYALDGANYLLYHLP